MGLSNSTASHAEPLEPGKGSNRIVRRREHGRTDIVALSHARQNERATLRSAPSGTQRGAPHIESSNCLQGKSAMKASGIEPESGRRPIAACLAASSEFRRGAVRASYGFRSMIPVCGA